MREQERGFLSRDLPSQQVPYIKLKKAPDKLDSNDIEYFRNASQAFVVSRQRRSRDFHVKRERRRRYASVFSMNAENKGKRYRKWHFEGACLDGGASKSVIGRRQAQAYCRMFKKEFRLCPSLVTFIFGNGSCASMGKLEIRLPLLDGQFLPFLIDVVDADIPLSWD